MTTVTEFRTMADVRRANRELGHFWFEPVTLRFFRSRVGESLYGGRYFVSSEQFEASDGTRAPRRYTVRQVNPDGSIDTVGEFQAYETSAQARAEIRRLLAE